MTHNPKREKIRAALTDRTRRQLEDVANVSGVGVGPKRTDGERVAPERNAIIVFVETKREREQLEDDELIPETITLENGLQVETDVQVMAPSIDLATEPDTHADELEDAPAIDDAPTVGNASRARKAEVRPLTGGLQISAGGGYGTCTGLFEDEDGDEVILSNRHVVADGQESPVGKTIHQPSGGSRIGTVKDSSPLFVGGTTVNYSDVAKIAVDNDVDASGWYLGYRDIDGTGRYDFSKRATVISCTEGITSGELIAEDVTTSVSFGSFSARFTGVVSYERVSGGGSSGSLVAHIDHDTGEATAIGIHFAGSSERSLLIPWISVERHMGTLEPIPAPDSWKRGGS